MRSVALVFLLVVSHLAHSSVIIESYQKPSADVNFGGLGIADNYWVYNNFEITEGFYLDSIGGYFSNYGDPLRIFGAVVQLDNINDIPDSYDLDTPDLLGTTTFEVDRTSQEDFSGQLSLFLRPGFYAVGFGLNAFGADQADFFESSISLASIIDDSLIVGSLPYTMIREGNPFGPEFFTYQLAAPRIFLQGHTEVSEPSLSFLFVLTLLFARRFSRN